MAVHVAELPATPPRPTRRGWLVPAVRAAALIGVLAVAGLYVWRHYKVGLFSAYRAGYAAVSPAPSPGAGIYDPTCDTAVRAAYPEQFAGLAADATWPQEAQAFYAGCTQTRSGQTADVWSMHGYLTSGRD